jgi:hypothetical protein
MIFEGMQDHTADSIKSLEGFGRAWVEEAQSISQRSLDILLPTIRADGSEIWFSGTRTSPPIPVDAFFAASPTRAVVRALDVRGQPVLPEVMRTRGGALKAADDDAYEHIWGGGYFLGGNGSRLLVVHQPALPTGNIDESIVDAGGELLVGMDFNVNPMSAVVGVRAVDELPRARRARDSDEQHRGDGGRVEAAVAAPRFRTGASSSVRIRRASSARRARRWARRTSRSCSGTASRCAHRTPRRPSSIASTTRSRCSARRQAAACASIPRQAADHRAREPGLQRRHEQPDKKSGFDHMCDALGYLLWQEFNVLSGRTSTPGARTGTSSPASCS